MTNLQGPAFRPLTGIFEPSAIQQLPDGRFLVVEDEKSHPLSLVTIGADGSVDSTALTAGLLQMFNRVVDPKVVDGLKSALTSRHAVLAAAAQVQDVKASGGLNIEALEISPDQKRLLIGFRSPLRDGRALIASVENPSAIFESD